MKKQAIYSLIIVLVTLVLIYIGVSHKRGRGTIRPPKDLSIALDSTFITRLEFMATDDSVVLVKDVDGWRMKKPLDYPANQEFAKIIAGGFHKATIDVMISD